MPSGDILRGGIAVAQLVRGRRDDPHDGERARLDLKRSSYEFHRQIESPLAFLRREWRTAAVCAGGFALAMVAAVFLVDPAFFYPRLQTDPLNYFLKAQAVAETGSSSVSWAVNLHPFAYVSMPGLLRLPAVMAFRDFDDQLRAIQLLNIPLVAALALMSAYVFSWVLPPARHRLAIILAFAFTLLSPIWIANVFLPLADAPYAVFTLATMFVSIELLCSDRRIAGRPILIAAWVGLFIISFLLRFTAPVLILYIALLAHARWNDQNLSRRLKVTAAGLVAAGLVVLVAFNIQPIFGRYLSEPLSFLRNGEKPGMFINLFGAAVPSQVIPSFQLGFMHPPIVDIIGTSFSSALPDMAWAGFGILISLVVAAGLWLSRDRLLPEIACVLAALPVITLMMPSTTRYLMTYQPFFWTFFYVGALWLARRHVPWILTLLRSRKFGIAAILLASALAVGLRAWKVAGSASERYFAVSATTVPSYVTDVSDTFRSLRDFLETLPRDRTLLIGGRGTTGRWDAIIGRDYYFPDSALSQVVREKDVYLLVECGTMEACQAWDIWKHRSKERVLTFGEFEFDSVFAAGSGRARAEVLRMRGRE